MADRPIVSVERCETYDEGVVEAALESVLAPLGGIRAFVHPGDQVFVKANLLMKAEPDRAISTHPAVIRAVVRAAKAAGAADIAMGDSPGGRTSAAAARALFETSGLARVAHEEDVRLVLLDDGVVRVPNPEARLYSAFNLGREAVECDVLIDVPRLKTHGFMMFTGAVKNLFGCIPGLEKAQFHLKVPDRADFAEMLIDLLLACRPGLCVMDAVVGMEGEGPSGGTPRHIGALLASADACHLDVVASSIAGFDPMAVYTVAAANGRGMCPASADDVETVGTAWRDLAPVAFAHPARDLSRAFPPAAARWLRRRISSRPVLARAEECTACGTCERNCPAQAVKVSEGRPQFDYDACIRCYCCQELCPANALDLKTPWIVRSLVMRGGSDRA